MSDLLIKGMKMPKSCWECFFFLNSTELFKCNLTHKNVGNCRKNRHKNCPFVEIPAPHGRLIDADAHIQSLKENQCGERCRKNYDCVNCGIGMYIRIVENEPTVIEAED